MNLQDVPEIKGYTLEKILGQGGMATIFLGLQENLNREVAIKVLNPDMFKDKQYLQRFLNEARTASKLSHPNIVTIHDVGQVKGFCYIVMERLQETLTERVKFKSDKRMHPHEAFKIILQVSSALDYAHREGVIHRDIKPDNILFRRDGTPVLVDFGIARALDSQAQLTTTGMIIGTPHYMSPEQCRGEVLDGASDIYGLGIVLYEILTGNVPYCADTTAGLLLKHVQEPVPPLPPELRKYQSLISKMMAKNKRERVRSGEELIHLIDAYGPDYRIETVKGVERDTWVFDQEAHQKTTPHPTPQPAPTAVEIQAPMRSEVLTLHTPLQEPVTHVKHKSRAMLFVMLVSIPLIAAAAGFLFFPDHFNRLIAPLLGDKNKTAVEEVKPPPQENVGEKDLKSPEGEKKDGSSRAQTQPETGPGNKDTAASNAARIDEEYQRYYTLAEEYFKNKNYPKALENIRAARRLKDTPESKLLEETIDARTVPAEDKEYIKYYTLAKDAFDNKNYTKARKNIRLARQHKSTEELETLDGTITAGEKKKKADAEAAAAKARKAAQRRKQQQKRDDDAYRTAKERNDIFAYEKYLKFFPKGRHVKDAQKRFDQLKEARLFEDRIKDDTDYDIAVSKGTIAHLEGYMKNHPSGRHLMEAEVKITQLKERLIKETKSKLELNRVRFFEGTRQVPARTSRSYSTRFAQGQARNIYVEISYRNRLFRVLDTTCNMRIAYLLNGSSFAEIPITIRLNRDTPDGSAAKGTGWAEPGKWTPGVYTVLIFLDGQKIGQDKFEVY